MRVVNFRARRACVALPVRGQRELAVARVRVRDVSDANRAVMEAHDGERFRARASLKSKAALKARQAASVLLPDAHAASSVVPGDGIASEV
jgi:hypothetical protein